jgi:hypothetical protein
LLVSVDSEDNAGEQGSIVSRSQLKSVSERLRRLANMDDLDVAFFWNASCRLFLVIIPGSAPVPPACLLLPARGSGGASTGDGGDTDPEIIVSPSGIIMVDRDELIAYPSRPPLLGNNGFNADRLGR